MSTVYELAVDHNFSGEIMMMTMTRHAFYAALLALFVAGSAMMVPLQAQTQEESKPAAQNERAPDRFGEPVTVRVTNDNWSDMRIYVVETATHHFRWRIGSVTSLSTASFEIPDHLGAELGHLVLVAEAIGSRGRQLTPHLQTWPGARVDWTLGAAIPVRSALSLMGSPSISIGVCVPSSVGTRATPLSRRVRGHGPRTSPGSNTFSRCACGR